MPSFRQLVLLGLPLLSLAAAQEPAAPSPTKGQTQNAVQAIYANANEAFQDLLNALPEESLHVALNTLNHYREGVFESNKRGVEHIHHDNPPLATKLIVAAVQDLKKRQAPAPSNGTSSATESQGSQSTDSPQSTQSPPESSQSPSESSQAPKSSQDQPQSTQAPESSNGPAPQSSAAPAESSAVIIPVDVTTTDSSGHTSVATSEILSHPTASVAVPVTRTNSEGSVQVTTETKPAVIFSTTNSAGQAIVTTSPVDFAPTKGQVLTKTDARGSTFLTTYTPGSGRVSSIVLRTTTGADGQQSIVTSYTYVDPAQATGGSTDGSGSTAKPSLQKGAAAANRVFDAAVLGGAALAWLV